MFGDEVESAEALREVILSQRRELDTLRRESADVSLLLDALDALLRVEGDEDPFANVFRILRPVFRFSDALVLIEPASSSEELTCVVATSERFVDATWPQDRLFRKVLAGRITATMTSSVIASSRAATAAGVVHPEQPALHFPLGNHRRRGMMVLLRPAGDEGFDRRDIELARKFSLLASHALAALAARRTEDERQRLHRLTEELRDAQATLAHRANHDVLTGLPNRAYFEEHVNAALASARDGSLALAFIDLDGFKQVNDRYGHEMGDRLLAQVAERIVSDIRTSDVLARISGDEFVLLIDPLEDQDVLDTIAERIRAELKAPFCIDGVRIALSASIGIASYPEHGTTYHELRRNADIAMYSAKSRAKGSIARFDVSLGRAVTERAEQEQTVRRAVAEARFLPVLQPLVALDTMAITGFEVLARREDDQGELHPPSEFIALAGELGFLDAITTMLLEEVTATLPALDARFGSGTCINLNVSARQAADVPGMRRLLDRLRDTGCPERFVIEVTEDAYLHAGIFQRQVLPLLREIGVRVSIDDFGAGYSSLATLLNLEAHELKIDRAFVSRVARRRRSQVILGGIAAAAHQLGIAVVAEGVETEAELRYLRSVPAIQRAQGYLFAEPDRPRNLLRSAESLTARLAALRTDPSDTEASERPSSRARYARPSHHPDRVVATPVTGGRS